MATAVLGIEPEVVCGDNGWASNEEIRTMELHIIEGMENWGGQGTLPQLLEGMNSLGYDEVKGNCALLYGPPRRRVILAMGLSEAFVRAMHELVCSGRVFAEEVDGKVTFRHDRCRKTVIAVYPKRRNYG